MFLVFCSTIFMQFHKSLYCVPLILWNFKTLELYIVLYSLPSLPNSYVSIFQQIGFYLKENISIFEIADSFSSVHLRTTLPNILNEFVCLNQKGYGVESHLEVISILCLVAQFNGISYYCFIFDQWSIEALLGCSTVSPRSFCLWRGRSSDIS